MILMGDEMRRSQQVNNNAYCHDNALNWLDWSLLEQNTDIFEFFKYCIEFRHTHPVLRCKEHFHHEDRVGSGYADITWHGTQAWFADWSQHVLTLAFMLDGHHARNGTFQDDMIYVAMNMHWEDHVFEIPGLPAGMHWHVFVNTGEYAERHIYKPGAEPVLEDQSHFMLGARSVTILVGR